MNLWSFTEGVDIMRLRTGKHSMMHILFSNELALIIIVVIILQSMFIFFSSFSFKPHEWEDGNEKKTVPL